MTEKIELIEAAMKAGQWDSVNALLDSWEMEKFPASIYYKYRSELSMHFGNAPNSWLWLWRGLENYPDDQVLKDLYTQADNKFPVAPLRVFQGTMEIANQMNTLNRGLRAQGITAHSLDYSPSYLGYGSDYTYPLLPELNRKGILEKLRRLTLALLPKYDLFHFHFAQSIALDYTDYPLLKQAGKSVIMQHWGSDVRLYSVAVKSNPYVLVKHPERILRQRLSLLSRHVQHCIVADRELEQYVKDYYPEVSIVPMMVDLARYAVQEEWKPNERLLIVHAPTSPEIKGTEVILKVIESLGQQYEFDFMLIQGMTHEEAKALYQKADLIIDQLHIGSYGLLAVESMALGKPVVCWISDYMTEQYPAELPLIRANPDTLQKVLEDLLKNRDALPEIGLRGRAYAEQHHDMVKNSQSVLDIYHRLLSI
ncbi:glycosyltransferase [Paenibacillus piscarius]|uniref:glycosyltransferase n=1 Tax=Paenibacillus piscarius TaxID=1089681 RepID=UPI001EE94FCE|nr:glycosyltransferase [Paenibacillus piscarius]